MCGNRNYTSMPFLLKHFKCKLDGVNQVWWNLTEPEPGLQGSSYAVSYRLPPAIPPSIQSFIHSFIRQNGGYINSVAHGPLHTSAERSTKAKTKTTQAAKDLFIGVLSVRQTTCVSLAIITTQGSGGAQWHCGSITGADKCTYLHCTSKEPNTDHTAKPRGTTCAFRSVCLLKPLQH